MSPVDPREHDMVALLVDLPDHDLTVGDVGAVVHVYGRDQAYEVEFLDIQNKTRVIVTLERQQLLRLNWSQAMSGTT